MVNDREEGQKKTNESAILEPCLTIFLVRFPKLMGIVLR